MRRKTLVGKILLIVYINDFINNYLYTISLVSIDIIIPYSIKTQRLQIYQWAKQWLFSQITLNGLNAILWHKWRSWLHFGYWFSRPSVSRSFFLCLNSFPKLVSKNFIKETPAQVLSCEFWRMLKNTYFEEFSANSCFPYSNFGATARKCTYLIRI